MRARTALPRALPALALAAIALAPGVASAQCVDEQLKQELVGGRHYRGVQDRLFVKALRHEFSFMGGLYGSDLYSSSWTAGGAYTFHFSEDLALEASVAFTKFYSQAAETYNRRYPQISLQENTDRDGRLYFGHLIWSFAYGKLRWMGGGISRFDFNLALGMGVTDDSSSLGLTGSFGLGAKLYFGKWFALRWDVRDRILKQTLVGEEHLVNDIVATLGFSVFVPFGF